VTTKIPDEIWDHCEGREVRLLNPIDCDVEPEENGSIAETSRKLPISGFIHLKQERHRSKYTLKMPGQYLDTL